MHDQANELRQLVRQRAGLAPATGRLRPKLVVVTSGKGGVGTTTLAVNLAVVLAQREARTVLVDADPDGPDVGMLCRLDDRYTIADVLSGGRTVREVLQRGPGGVQVLPGAWGLGDTAECSAGAQQRLLDQLLDLGGVAEWIVVDAGDGLGRLVRRFWEAADVVLLVTTPELPSVMDAYASIKVLAGGNDSVPIRPVVNMATCPADVADVQGRLFRACQRFLGLSLAPPGHVPHDPEIVTAGKTGEPFVLAAPDSDSARQIHRLTEMLAERAEPSAVGFRPSAKDGKREPAL